MLLVWYTADFGSPPIITHEIEREEDVELLAPPVPVIYVESVTIETD